MPLLLVEDDHHLAHGIARALAKASYAADVAATVEDARQRVATRKYEGCILDLGLPDGDGLALLRTWRAAGIQFPVLVLSARVDLSDRIMGLDSGADDYLVKPFALGELEARIRALLRRPDHQLTWYRIGRLQYDSGSRRILVDGQELDLTRRETDVLHVLVTRGGRMAGKQDIIDAVFPCEADIGPNALEAHVSRLRQKLRAAGVHIRAIRGLGYRIENASSDADADETA